MPERSKGRVSALVHNYESLSSIERQRSTTDRRTSLPARAPDAAAVPSRLQPSVRRSSAPINHSANHPAFAPSHDAIPSSFKAAMPRQLRSAQLSAPSSSRSFIPPTIAESINEQATSPAIQIREEALVDPLNESHTVRLLISCSVFVKTQ